MTYTFFYKPQDRPSLYCRMPRSRQEAFAARVRMYLTHVLKRKWTSIAIASCINQFTKGQFNTTSHFISLKAKQFFSNFFCFYFWYKICQKQSNSERDSWL